MYPNRTDNAPWAYQVIRQVQGGFLSHELQNNVCTPTISDAANMLEQICFIYTIVLGLSAQGGSILQARGHGVDCNEVFWVEGSCGSDGAESDRPTAYDCNYAFSYLRGFEL